MLVNNSFKIIYSLHKQLEQYAKMFCILTDLYSQFRHFLLHACAEKRALLLLTNLQFTKICG